MASSPALLQPDAPSGPAVAPSEGGRTRSRWEWMAILAAMAAVFVLRYAILVQQGGYPPSEDAAGDLSNARLWITGSFQGTTSALLFPPVYYFLIVLPLTATLPVLTAVEVMMALVPALVIAPAYALLRRQGVLRPVALLFGAILALTPAYSNMITWNSAYNMFAIVLMVSFFAFLLAYLDRPTRRDLWASAALFSLVLGSHELTAVVLIETTILFFLLLAGQAAAQRRIREAVQLWVPLGIRIALLSLLWLPIYIYSYLHVTNVGYSSGLINWPAYLANGVAQAWIGGSVTLVYVDVGVSVAGIAALALSARRYLQVSLLLVALFVGSISVGILDSPNAVRGLLFLPVVFVLALAPPISDAFRYLLRPAATSSLAPHAAGPRPTGTYRKTRARLRELVVSRTVVIVVGGVAVGGFACANAANSEGVFATSAAFNSVLTPQYVAVMDWMNAHAPHGAVVYVPSPALGWAQYFDPNQTEIGPYESALNVVTNGLSTITAANEAYLGAYTVGNGYLGASMNYPGFGTPLIWIGSSGYNELFGTATNGTATLNVSAHNASVTLWLNAAQLVSVSNQTLPGSEAGSMTFMWHWVASNITLDETIAVASESLSIAWAPTTAGVSIVSAKYGFQLPPTTYYFTYTSVPVAQNVTNLSDGFLLIEGFDVQLPFTLDVVPGGGTVSQSPESDGWTFVNASFSSNLSLRFSGLPRSPNDAGVYFANATALLRGLGVSYVLVDSATDSGLYSYLAKLNVTGFAHAAVVDAEAPWYAFHLTYA